MYAAERASLPNGSQQHHKKHMATTTDDVETERLEQDALHLVDQGRHEQALALLKSLHAPSANALCNIGTLLLELNPSAASSQREALDMYQRAVAMEPRNFTALANLAMTTLAVADYEAALGVNAKWAEGHAALGSLLDDAGQPARAIAHLRRASELAPGDEAALFNLALVQAKVGNLADALASAKRVIRLNAKHGPANALLAELLWRAGGQPKETLHFAKRAVDSDDEEARLSGCLVAAIAAEQSDTPGDAEGFLRIGAAMARGQMPCLVRLGALLLRLGRPRDAAEAWGRVDCDADDALGRALIDGLLCRRTTLGFVPVVGPLDTPASVACETWLLHCKLGDALHLVNKALLARALHAAKHDDDVMPRSLCCKSAKEAQLAMKKLGGALVYLKDPALQRGQGIRLVSDPAHMTDDLFARVQVVQRAVEPLLIDGYKFGVRVNALCVRFAGRVETSVFVLEEGLFTRCGAKYDAKSNDLAVHVSSTAVQKASENFDLTTVKGTASQRFHGFASSFSRVCWKISACVQAAMDAGWRASMPVEPVDTTVLQMFGFDVIWDDQGEPWICEANASPQFQDAKKLADLRAGFFMPMVNGLPALVAAGFDGRAEATTGWRHVADV